MALNLRLSLLVVLGGCVLFATPACGSDSDKKGDDDDDSCEVDFDCKRSEICSAQGKCVPDPGAGGSNGTAGTAGTAGSTASGGAGTGGSGVSGTNGVSGSSSNTGGTSSSGSGGQPPTAGTSGTAGTAGTATSGSGGTSGTAECTTDDPITCLSTEEMVLCIDGMNTTFNCTDACEQILGFETGPCEEGNGCMCGDPLDEDCSIGVSALCACSDPPCTDDEALDLYIGCFSNDPPEYADAIRCLVDYVDIEAQQVDCEAGIPACAPDNGEGGAGGAP